MLTNHYIYRGCVQLRCYARFSQVGRSSTQTHRLNSHRIRVQREHRHRHTGTIARGRVDTTMSEWINPCKYTLATHYMLGRSVYRNFASYKLCVIRRSSFAIRCYCLLFCGFARSTVPFDVCFVLGWRFTERSQYTVISSGGGNSIIIIFMCCAELERFCVRQTFGQHQGPQQQKSNHFHSFFFCSCFCRFGCWWFGAIDFSGLQK